MSHTGGRPSKVEQDRRAGKFLCLIADGLDAVQARKQAGLNPDIALRIVTESDYLDVVRAIRDGAGPVVAVLDGECVCGGPSMRSCQCQVKAA